MDWQEGCYELKAIFAPRDKSIFFYGLNAFFLPANEKKGKEYSGYAKTSKWRDFSMTRTTEPHLLPNIRTSFFPLAKKLVM